MSLQLRNCLCDKVICTCERQGGLVPTVIIGSVGHHVERERAAVGFGTRGDAGLQPAWLTVQQQVDCVQGREPCSKLEVFEHERQPVGTQRVRCAHGVEVQKLAHGE